ncbi:MAG: zinc ribbon domain-containing protein [Promethearchaeota archaeon]
MGIEFEQIKECGTSSICPVCGTKVKPSARTFRRSSCGYTQDRDVFGCIMILKTYAEVNHFTLWVENHPVVSAILLEREGRRIYCL